VAPADPITCHRCHRPVKRAVYVEGQAGQQGPFGRECARLVIVQLAKWNITAKRRRARA